MTLLLGTNTATTHNTLHTTTAAAAAAAAPQSLVTERKFSAEQNTQMRPSV